MATTPETFTCPKCGAPCEEYERVHNVHPGCPYVPCDDSDCEALKEPVTDNDVWTALQHWRDHSLHGGCSHGC